MIKRVSFLLDTVVDPGGGATGARPLYKVWSSLFLISSYSDNMKEDYKTLGLELPLSFRYTLKFKRQYTGDKTLTMKKLHEYASERV